jgi:hypothetical protein
VILQIQRRKSPRRLYQHHSAAAVFAAAAAADVVAAAAAARELQLKQCLLVLLPVAGHVIAGAHLSVRYKIRTIVTKTTIAALHLLQLMFPCARFRESAFGLQ